MNAQIPRITKAELARQVGVSRPGIRYWMDRGGKPKEEVIERFNKLIVSLARSKKDVFDCREFFVK